MLVDFLNVLEIKNEEGVVENLPAGMDDAKLKSAIETLLAKYPPEAVAVYLNAFNDMNETTGRISKPSWNPIPGCNSGCMFEAENWSGAKLKRWRVGIWCVRAGSINADDIQLAPYANPPSFGIAPRPRDSKLERRLVIAKAADFVSVYPLSNTLCFWAG